MLNPSTYAALFANDELYQFADNNRWLQVDQGQYDDALQAIRGQEYSNVALEDRYNFALNHLGIGMNIDELVDLYFDAISDGLYSTPIVPEVLENTQYYIRQRAGLTQ